MVPIAQMDQDENTKAPEEIRLAGRPVSIPARRCIRTAESGLPLSCGSAGRQRWFWSSKVSRSRASNCSSPRTITGDRLSTASRSWISPDHRMGLSAVPDRFPACASTSARRKNASSATSTRTTASRRSRAGRTPRSRSVEEILEALEIIASTDSESKAYTVTGGSITGKLDGRSEVEFYVRYPEAIEKRFPGRWISKVVVQALPKDEVQRFQDAGVQIYHPNYEIWDERLFEIFCAGKARYIGREEWIRRILDAADVFGPENVIPNFVAGVEMAGRHGFARWMRPLPPPAKGWTSS